MLEGGFYFAVIYFNQIISKLFRLKTLNILLLSFIKNYNWIEMEEIESPIISN